ncbi:MAG: phosphonate ABC transporter ATP-binding protein [Rhodospirillales bacterium]
MLKLDQIAVTYPGGVEALRPATVEMQSGEFVVLLGPSGAGKSTLLRAVNGLVTPTGGRTVVNGIGEISDAATLREHRKKTAMVFQQHQLIGRLSALQNVLTGRLPYHSAWRSLLPLPAEDKKIALECLERVGLLGEALRRADQMSGGQQQRVGIARALAQRPTLMLADEPVASLDPETSAKVLRLLHGICRKDGIAAIVSLHQVELAQEFADRIIGIAAGHIVYDGTPEGLTTQVLDAIYRSDRPEPPLPKQSSPSEPNRNLGHDVALATE